MERFDTSKAGRGGVSVSGDDMMDLVRSCAKEFRSVTGVSIILV